MGKFDFQPDATERTRLSIIYHFFQEVTLLVLPTPKEKAAVAPAASGAQKSALPSNPIVPSLCRNAMGFRSFLSPTTPLNPQLRLRLHSP